MRNRFPGMCLCGRRVLTGSGFVSNIDGKWSVSCAAHSTHGRRKPRIVDEQQRESQKERSRLRNACIPEGVDRKAAEAHVALAETFARFEAESKAEHIKAVASLPLAAKCAYYSSVCLRLFGLGVWWITPKPLGLIPIILLVAPAKHIQAGIASKHQAKLIVPD